jgi:hypothetical protein
MSGKDEGMQGDRSAAAAIIAVTTMTVAILLTVMIAGVSLVNSDRMFAPRQFARLVRLYYRDRMYQ